LEFSTENQHLIITPENKISEWQKVLLSELDNKNEVFFVFDTETTGLTPYGDSHNNFTKDRMVEVGIVPFIRNPKTGETYQPKDSKGQELFFHEYINFLNESEKQLMRNNSINYVPREIEMITGITQRVLEGKQNLPGLDKTLPKSAPTFQQIFPYLSDFLLLEYATDYYSQMCGVAHNASFDYAFFNAEMENIGHSPLESYIKKIDTVTLAQQCIKSEDYEVHNKENEEKINHLKEKIKDGINNNSENALNRLKLDYARLLDTLSKNVESMEMKARGAVKTTGNSKQAVQTNLRNNLWKIKETVQSDDSMEFFKANPDKIDDIYHGISIVTKVNNYTLDDLQKYFKITTEREMHGALLDTQILLDVFSRIISLDSYKNAPNMPPKHTASVTDFIKNKKKRMLDLNRNRLTKIKIQ
jgi:DNA polymerase III epsilon subunit-like protein